MHLKDPHELDIRPETCAFAVNASFSGQLHLESKSNDIWQLYGRMRSQWSRRWARRGRRRESLYVIAKELNFVPDTSTTDYNGLCFPS